ncbi:FxsA family protein [Vibrio metschnikovii]|uniref:FxsA family protein n=1 Tax=bacterium 19MO02SH05 TaxID=2920696 RepID=A0AAU6TIA3_UNCXX|nr:FxsA family protein [Vibrio metschnikovii]EKO3588557.1 FxsA family protein [Vibrio metschnikovii]EKO3716766.1 FxsA family protein [Vibrio metschnikovii]EKO3719719.1 FxsA family protein [Vibrio metschnikovii]EKO3735658.1 FxsA family protein [Vibrio metschnikovii]EKO3745684.1 FxsA family protein [Vibrio metschnikovii]
MLILLCLFIALPIIEIAVLIQLGGFLGLWPTLGLILFTALVGAILVRSQGVLTFLSVQQRLQRGEVPAQQIIEGMLLAVAGVLLLTPGFITDGIGMLVLLPIPRARLAHYLMGYLVVNTMSGPDSFSHQSSQSRPNAEGDTFDGEYEYKEQKDHPRDDSNRLN